MVIEFAMLTCAEADRDNIEAALDATRPLFHNAVGCRAVSLLRSDDRPGTYCLRVEWETIEHHLNDFLGSPALGEFERLVGPYLSAPPHITHFHPLFEDRIA